MNKIMAATKKNIIAGLRVLLAVLIASPTSVYANPYGGSVAAGAASIVSSGQGSVVTVQQTSNLAIINWQGFSINAGELTQFIQPSALSAALNRVTGGNPSAIYGTLQANGKIYLINPNGITVGPTGVINTQSFIASTLDVQDSQFLSGGALNFSGSSLAGIYNAGKINALGGDVFLFANTVQNSGSISAPQGTAGLAAGFEILLNPAGDQRVFVQAGNGAAAVGVDQQGQIQAATAELAAAGGNVYGLAVNNTGIVRADAVATVGGRIFLTASGGSVSNAGQLVATQGTQGGQVQIVADDITLKSGSKIDVSGQNGGGTALIGGDEHGANPNVPDATNVTVEAGAAIDADALENGNGGKVVVWSNGTTIFDGAISARGGAAGGNGGFAEVSGHTLDLNGFVDLGAPKGVAGTLLLDPYDVTIDAGYASTLESELASENVDVEADDAITVAAAVAWSSGYGLSLTADNNIYVNAPITASGRGSLTMTSGAIALGANITTTGGAQSYNGAVTLTQDEVLGSGGGDVTFQNTVDGSYALSINASGSDAVTVGGNGANGGNISIDGAVTISGDLTLAANGGAGAQGFVANTSVILNSLNGGNGGAGGAAGSIVLGGAVNVGGAMALTANGGVGGPGGNGGGNSVAHGGDGGIGGAGGAINFDAAVSGGVLTLSNTGGNGGAGGTNYYGSNGGNGANGGNGGNTVFSGTANLGDGSTLTGDGGAGGGGAYTAVSGGFGGNGGNITFGDAVSGGAMTLSSNGGAGGPGPLFGGSGGNGGNIAFDSTVDLEGALALSNNGGFLDGNEGGGNGGNGGEATFGGAVNTNGFTLTVNSNGGDSGDYVPGYGYNGGAGGTILFSDDVSAGDVTLASNGGMGGNASGNEFLGGNGGAAGNITLGAGVTANSLTATSNGGFGGDGLVGGTGGNGGVITVQGIVNTTGVLNLSSNGGGGGGGFAGGAGGNGGSIVLNNQVSAGSLSLASNGAAAIPGGAAGDDGSIYLAGGNIDTSGAQSYSGNVSLGGDTVMNSLGGDVTLTGTVNGVASGAQNLTINTETGAGDTLSNGAVTLGTVGNTNPLAGLDIVGNDGGLTLNGNITTASDQNYGRAVVIGGDVALNFANATNSGNITFQNTVDGAHNLTMTSGGGAVSVVGDVGDNTPLSSLTVNASGADGAVASANGGNGGGINFGGPVTLSGGMTLTSNGGAGAAGAYVSIGNGGDGGNGGNGGAITLTGPAALGGGLTLNSNGGAAGVGGDDGGGGLGGNGGAGGNGGSINSGGATLGGGLTVASSGGDGASGGATGGMFGTPVNGNGNGGSGGNIAFSGAVNSGGDLSATSNGGNGGFSAFGPHINGANNGNGGSGGSITFGGDVSGGGMTVTSNGGTGGYTEIDYSLYELNGGAGGAGGAITFDGSVGLSGALALTSNGGSGGYSYFGNGAGGNGGGVLVDGPVTLGGPLTVNNSGGNGGLGSILYMGTGNSDGGNGGNVTFNSGVTGGDVTVNSNGGYGGQTYIGTGLGGGTGGNGGQISFGGNLSGGALTLASNGGLGGAGYDGDGGNGGSGGNITIAGAAASGGAVSLTSNAGAGGTGNFAYTGGAGVNGGNGGNGGNIVLSGTADSAGGMTLTSGAGAGGDSFGGAPGINGIAGNVTLDGTVGGITTPNFLDVAAANIYINGSGVTVNGSDGSGNGQSYSGAVVLGHEATLDSSISAGNIVFQNTVDGPYAMTVNAGGGLAVFNGAVGVNTALSGLSVTAGGINLNGGAFDTSGAQSYSGAVTLGADTVMNSLGGAVSLAGTLNGVASGAQALTINTETGAGDTVANGAVALGTVGNVNPLSSLTIVGNEGGLALNGDITSVSDQTYGRAVTLGGDVALNFSNGTNSGNVTFQRTVDGNHGLNVNAGSGAVAFDDSVGGSSQLSYLDVTAGGGIAINGSVVNTVGNGNADASGYYGGQIYNGNVVVGNSGASLTAAKGSNGTTSNDGAITFNGAIELGASGLTTVSDGNTQFNGSVGSGVGTGSLNATVAATGLGTLSVNAPINNVFDVSLDNLVANTAPNQLANNGDIRINNAITATDNLNIVGNNRVYVGAPVAANSGNINDNGHSENYVWGTVNGFTVTHNGTYGSPGIVVSDFATAPYTWDGVDSLFTLISPLNADVLNSDMLLFNPNNVTLNAAVNDPNGIGAISLTANNGNFRVNAAITDSNASNFSINAMGAGGNVYLDAPISNSRGSLAITSQGGNILVDAPATITNTGAGSLQLSAASGAIDLDANISSVHGSQQYTGPVVLGGDVALTSNNGAITLNGSVDAAAAGQAGLTVTTLGNATFGGVVGGTGALGALNVSAGHVYLNGGAVNTSGSTGADNGSQVYNGIMVLGNNTAFTASEGSFAGPTPVDGAITLNGAASSPAGFAYNLTTVSDGDTAFNGALNRIGSLSADLTGADGAAAIRIGAASIKTTSGQTYSGPVVVGANTTLTNTGGTINFNGTVDDASAGVDALTLADGTGGVTFSGAVGGATALGSLTTTGAGPVEVNGGAVTTTAGQSYNGAVNLGQDTTMTNGSGSIDFKKTVDGPFALNVAAGSGNATFVGVVGGAAAFTSLSVTGNTALNASAVTTTGGQTYGGPVVVGKTATLTSGGAVNFAGTVDDSAAGTHVLTLAAAGGVTFAGAVGAGTALKTLTVNGTANAAINGGGVTTTAGQTYNGTVSLGADTNLDTGGGNVVLKGAVTGGSHALSVNAGAGSITTSGAISAGAISLTGGNVTWSAAMSGTSIDIFGTNLVMKGNLTTTTSAGVLMVAATSFKNSGHDSISLLGGGRWLIYSYSPASNVNGGLTGSTEFSTSYPTAPSFAGNGFVYSNAF